MENFLFILYLVLMLISIWIILEERKRKNYFLKNEERDLYIETWVRNVFDGKKLGLVKNQLGIHVYETSKKYIIFIAGYIINKIKVNKIKELYPASLIIILDGEPHNLSDINLNKKDIIITTKQDLLPDKTNTVYFPEYAVSFFENLNLNNLRKNDKFPKKKFCYFAYSNCEKRYEGVKIREEFYKKMQEITGNRVDNLGKCLGGSSIGRYSSNSSLTEYKFVIAIENSFVKGYITEKLINPRFAGSIPIYLGAPDVGKYFNTKSFIHIRDFPSFESCINYVLEVDRNKDLFKEILGRPFFKKEALGYAKDPQTYICQKLRNSSISNLLRPPRIRREI